MDASAPASAPPAEPPPPAVPAPAPGSTAPSASTVAPAELPELVAFEGVTKTFGEPPHAKVAIQDVSFVVRDLPNLGELIALVGPSGCGKSTILRIIAGLGPHFPPTRGLARVFGKPIGQPGADRGLVDQKYSLLPHLTVVENIAFGLKLRGVPRKERQDRARAWIAKVGLEGSEAKYPSELSGGMQQRVAIAATLILGPRILLMDEPFGALDAQTRELMQEELNAIWQQTRNTVLFVTHDIDEAIYLADRVIVFTARPGRIKDEIRIELERPRRIDVKKTAAYMSYRNRVWDSLRDEVLKAREEFK